MLLAWAHFEEGIWVESFVIELDQYQFEIIHAPGLTRKSFHFWKTHHPFWACAANESERHKLDGNLTDLNLARQMSDNFADVQQLLGQSGLLQSLLQA
jgi:hypothetical protein